IGGHSGADAGLAVAHGTTRGEGLAAGDGIAGRFGGRWRGNGDGGSRGHEYRAEGAGRCFHRHPHKLTLKNRSEEHTSELQSLMRISYAVFCLKKKTT